MSRRSPAPGRLLLVAPLAWLACAGVGISQSELPSDPLAFVYRTETEAQRRLETLARKQGTAGQPGRGVARLQDMGSVLGLEQDPSERRAAMLGRLSFFDLRAGDIAPAEFALAGARPLDWSPDRQRLLLMSLRSGSPQIYEWNRAGGRLRPITQGPRAHPAGCFGPDGRYAFVTVEFGARAGSRVWITDPGGGGARPLTPGPSDGTPAWSPDGSVIVYEVRPHKETAVLAAIDPEGGEPRVIARGRRPVFTSDGQWVIYSAKTPKGWRLRKMRPDGTGKLAFGDSVNEEHSPAVSPDGRFVVYVTGDGERERLRVRALDGHGDRPLINHGDGIAPVWN